MEDDEDDIFFMKRALKAAHIANPLYVVEDGNEAVNYLAGMGRFSDRSTYPIPAVVFLDLKLPYKSGHDVLAWIRTQEQLKGIIVVVLTSSGEPSDIRRAYSLGARSYMVKPPGVDDLLELEHAFKIKWMPPELSATVPA
ncbi:MAG TPA: response regulator [Candidatus Saccharimonadales bacterium]|nr:response regulator [Candidatus Saccharimonadales bacterium]